jgi:hypothetical protein
MSPLKKLNAPRIYQAAKEIAMTIPPNVLVRTDTVIR